jgi:lysophospholipase L1-like esterase
MSNLKTRAGLAEVVRLAAASTLNQNVSWTIDRTGTTAKYRVVAYGDSIYAGYNGSISNAAKYSAPTVDAEYLAALWNADIESVRRAKSGAIASDVYNNKIVAERSYMQATSTRVVTFEMCGNDGLQARTSFKGQTGTCNYSVLTTAVNNCKTYVAAAMDYINANAYSGVKLKVIGNLYYPGYNADNVLSSCNDPVTGAKVNLRDKFLPAIAQMNYWMCEYARQKGFQCADNFAQYMGADYDSNGDGQIDSDALKYVLGESESSYLTRITGDAASDPARRQHPLRVVVEQLRLHPVGRCPSDLHRRHRVRRSVRRHHRHGRARYTSFAGGKSPIWNQYGHERMGWAPRQHILWSRTWKGTTIRPAISLLMSRAAHNPAWLKSSPD